MFRGAKKTQRKEVLPDTFIQWNDFCSEAYFEDNYKKASTIDRKLADMLRAFCIKYGPFKNSIDVGTGTNLIPYIVRENFVQTSILFEYSDNNIKWLKNVFENQSLLKHWSNYLPTDVEISPFNAPIIEKGSIFEPINRKFDLATMFFCAESITSEINEFISAINNFVNCLNPDGYYFIALMRNSLGYSVNGIHYPAVSIDEHIVQHTFSKISKVIYTKVIESDGSLDRDQFDGFVVVAGQK